MTYHAQIVTAFAIGAIGLSSLAFGGSRQVNISTTGDQADCSSIQVRSADLEIAAGEETLSAGAGAIDVSPGGNGGVRIIGAADGAFSITACKFAFGRDRTDAEARLREITIENSGGQVRAHGPASDVEWHVFFIVRTPHGGEVTATTSNGPITIRDVDATVVAKATNGPISIRDSRGRLEARTVNGPISVQDVAGDVKVSAENGPLTVTLRGSEWEGEGLDGRTSNGPLTLSVPSGYASGIVVEAEGRSPFTCRTCTDAQRTWNDESRRVQMGFGPERVRLRTANGPVTVKD
jgi:DUF4097 and DUF4098 domain-containing protein YvlB